MRGLFVAAALLGAASCAPLPASPEPTALPQPASRPRLLPLGAIEIEGSAQQGGVLRGRAPPGTVALALDGAAVEIAPDRSFLIAFDRDATGTRRLVARAADGREAGVPLAVAPRAWRIERLSTLRKVPVPSADFQRRRPTELARIAAARASVSGASGWRQRFVWPATGRISGLFGSQRIYRGEPGSYHSGVDVAKPTGAPVVAPADGVVILAADVPFTLEGNLLMIDHGAGLNSAFLHLSRIDVAPGQHVRQGERIGAVGATGRATGPHLHWAMKWRDARIDPMLIAGPMEPR